MRIDACASGFTLTWDRFAAVYNEQGELVYAHYRRKGRYIGVSEKHCNVLASLRRQGEMQMRKGSPLRRRTIDAINFCRSAENQE